MAKVISIELDTNVENGQLEPYLDELERVFGVVGEVVKEVGPAGGAPVVRYTGEIAKIEEMVHEEFTSPGMTPAERLHEVAFLVHGEE